MGSRNPGINRRATVICPSGTFRPVPYCAIPPTKDLRDRSDMPTLEPVRQLCRRPTCPLLRKAVEGDDRRRLSGGLRDSSNTDQGKIDVVRRRSKFLIYGGRCSIQKSEVRSPDQISFEFPDSQIAKDPERGRSEDLQGGRATFALVADLLFQPLALRFHKGVATQDDSVAEIADSAA
jgi:hypothetical protein